MKKLINGILEFQHRLQPKDRETFAKLALGQSPDALFIGCSDSRVAVNVFASTDPGDLFVVRNVGNLVPQCGSNGLSMNDQSAPAAIEFALNIMRASLALLGRERANFEGCGRILVYSEIFQEKNKIKIV
ncbi:MAG: carbonic anhydrase [Bacteriovoracaceae bacterium]